MKMTMTGSPDQWMGVVVEDLQAEDQAVLEEERDTQHRGVDQEVYQHRP